MLYNNSGMTGAIWGNNSSTGGNYGNSTSGEPGYAYTAFSGSGNEIDI
jgi:hypothetical protein